MAVELKMPKVSVFRVCVERTILGLVFGGGTLLFLAVAVEVVWNGAGGQAPYYLAVAALCGWLTRAQWNVFARARRGEEDPSRDDKTGSVLFWLFAIWAVVFLAMCMPYFMRPWTQLKEMEAAIAARAPQAARFKELDESGRRALALELLPLLNDPDKMTRAGARHYLARIAWKPGAPAEAMVPPLLAELRQAQGTPDGAAGILAQLGEPGRAALFEALSSSNTWAADAAALELARMKPPPAGAADAVRAAIDRTPKHQRLGLEIALDRIEGRRR